MLYNSCHNKIIHFFKYSHFLTIFKLGLVWSFHFKFGVWANVTKHENKSGCIISEFVYIPALNIKRGVSKILRTIAAPVGYLPGKPLPFFQNPPLFPSFNGSLLNADIITTKTWKMLETLHFFCPLHHVFTSANRLVDNMAMTKSTLASGLLFFPVQFRRQGRFHNIKIYAWGGRLLHSLSITFLCIIWIYKKVLWNIILKT